MATLRPETVYGVTHALINPEATYNTVNVDGEKNGLYPKMQLLN